MYELLALLFFVGLVAASGSSVYFYLRARKLRRLYHDTSDDLDALINGSEIAQLKVAYGIEEFEVGRRFSSREVDQARIPPEEFLRRQLHDMRDDILNMLIDEEALRVIRIDRPSQPYTELVARVRASTDSPRPEEMSVQEFMESHQRPIGTKAPAS